VSQIILAQESDFNLGGLKVCPSKRQVVIRSSLSAPAGRELPQPRIMQVLVVLARRRGEVVSRDEMMAVCWGGFAVSDDAINRCIARLRRLSERHGGFTVETIARVGYQLSEALQESFEAQHAEEEPSLPSTPLSPVLSEASITALLTTNPVLEPITSLTVAPPSQSWAERHGVVAAIAFAAGVFATAALFTGAHFL